MTATLRLLQVSSHGADAGVGGVGKHMMRHGRLMPGQGFDVSFLCAFPEAVPPPGPTMVLHTGNPRQSRARRVQNVLGDVLARPGSRLEDAVDWARPDVVHTHSLPGISTGLWEICRRRRIPVVHTLHDYQLLCPRVTLTRRDGSACSPHPMLCGFRRERMLRWSAGVSWVLAPTKHMFVRHRGIFPEDIERVMPNPYDADSLGVRAAPPSERPRNVGFLGRLDISKGLHELLAAAPDLDRLGCTLHIAGQGRMRDDVEEAARVHPNVRYHGIVRGDEKAAFLARCDIGLIPSTWEEPAGPVNVMLEWLAAGRPVLSSPRGGLAEALAEQPGAIEVEPERAAIVGEIERLLDDPGAWSAAVERAQVIPGDMDEDRWARAHAEIFRAVVEGRRPERL